MAEEMFANFLLELVVSNFSLTGVSNLKKGLIY